MKVRSSGFPFKITAEDLIVINSSIELWQKRKINFDGAMLYNFIEAWEQFIDTEWDTWDISEYNHYIVCRYWIQIAIEYSLPKTKEKLVKYLTPLDMIFTNKMKPKINIKYNKIKVFKSQPYFWELNTIYPEV